MLRIRDGHADHALFAQLADDIDDRSLLEINIIIRCIALTVDTAVHMYCHIAVDV